MHLIVSILIRIVLTIALVGAYTMFALGIVFIYRGSKVLNLAHGAMAMFPAYIAYSVATGSTPLLLRVTLGVSAGLAGGIASYPRLRKRFNFATSIALSLIAAAAGALITFTLFKHKLPPLLALLTALLVGGAIGFVVERLVVRRLRASSPTAQTVGTVAVLGLLIALAARIWGTTPIRGPNIFPAKVFPVGNSNLQLGDIGLFVVALIVAAGFMALFKFTDLGLALRAAADNRRAAALMGIDPDRTTSLAWVFAGALAALGGVLLGASTNLHPFTLSLQVLPAFVAALIGGLESVQGALYGSLIVGLTVGIVPTLPGFGKQVGAAQVGLAILAFAVMIFRGQRFSASDVRSGL
ncbi:MAG: branched-chain amino acid ABC transporter permease [Actinomycetota bacterium]|nr:branched-chain amino acid ABC transporter permease [Actinomycetota bacterium]